MATIFRTQTILTGVAGSPYYSNMYWDLSVAPADTVTLTAEFWAIVSEYMVNEISWEVNGVVPTIDTTDGEILGATVHDAETGIGEASGEMLPTSTQALVKWRTGIYTGGREIRGRTFIPGISEPSNDNGHFHPDNVSALNTALSTWLGSLSATPVIWSRVNGTAASVLAAEVWDQFAVLRSRRD